MVCDGPGMDCGGLPLEVTACPVCSHGIKPARGWTWINAKELFPQRESCGNSYCSICPAYHRPERAGLIWIGEKFYPTPRDFTKETMKMGCSRRITAVPRDFKLGETWVFLGHKKGSSKRCACGRICENCEPTGLVYMPAIFHIFKPSRIEQIVGPDAKEEDEAIKKLRKRGIEPVIVERIGEQGELLPEE
jgi:hypothetical protein